MSNSPFVRIPVSVSSRAAVGLGALLAASLVAFADDYIPPRFLQTSHTTPWTWPEASTKSVSVNHVPGSGPVETPYLVDWNTEYIVYSLRYVNERTGGNICCVDAPWPHDVIVRFAIESPYLGVGTDVVPYDDNPQKELLARPLTAVGTTPTGIVYEHMLPAGDADLAVWFAFMRHLSPPTLADLNIVDVRLVGVMDEQQESVPFGIGWNAHARFIVEGFNSALRLLPVNDPGSDVVIQFDHMQTTTKIPMLDTEVLSEGIGAGLGPGGANEYRWQRILLKGSNVEEEPGTWHLGGVDARFTEPMTFTIHQAPPTGALEAATAGFDFHLVRPDGSIVPRMSTVPETWRIEIPANSSVFHFGVRVLREKPAWNENGWEELVLALGAPPSTGGGAEATFPPGSGLIPPTIGWKSKLRFLIQDGRY